MLNCEITRVLRCCLHLVVCCELYNHTTVRPFKGNKLIRNEYCGNFASLRAKMFSRLDLNQEGEVLVDSLESRPWG